MIDAGVELVFVARRLAGGEEVVLVGVLIGRKRVWRRAVFQEISRDGIEALSGDSVSGEGQTCIYCPGVSQADSQNDRQRIVQRDELAASVPQIGEVALLPGFDGNASLRVRGASRSCALLSEEEECAIFAVVETGNRDRAADCSTELVSLEGGTGDTVSIVSPTIRIELAVAQKLEKRAMEFIAARTRGNVDDAAAGPAILGRERVADDVELGDAVDNRCVACLVDLTLFSGRMTDVPSMVISLDALRPPLIHGVEPELLLEGITPVSGSRARTDFGRSAGSRESPCLG